MKITRKEIVNGEWWAWVNTEGFNCEIMISKEEPTEKDAEIFIEKLNEINKQRDIDSVIQIEEKIESLNQEKVELLENIKEDGLTNPI
jgi:hypothetical protein